MRKILALSFAFSLISAQTQAANTVHNLEVLSPIYKIDKIIKSMEGPQSSQPVYLTDSQPPELLWITGFKTDMVGADGKTPSLPEFMCHVNLDYNPGLHSQLFNGNSGTNARLLTLSQGQINTQFPEGFGLPIMSNEPVSMNTQVLNFNLENPNLDVRHKVTFSFVKDSELKEPMKPLFNTSGFGMAQLEGTPGAYGIPEHDESKHGPNCLPGEAAPNARGGSVYQDGFNRKFSGHWVVKPGREVNHTNITKYLNLPFDTTLHYAAVHLHPFSESLELRDVTAKKSIFKSKTKNFKNKIGLIDVSSFSSKKGVALYKDHEYELISTYNNTTKANQDSMAVMMLFLFDKNFKKPAPPSTTASLSPLQSLMGVSNAAKTTLMPTGTRPYLLLHTTAGDLLAELHPDLAPKTVEQIIRLVKGGLYDSTPFFRLEQNFVLQTANVQGRSLPITSEQQLLIQRIPAEFGGLKHQRGMLSMARADGDVNSAESSFSILLADAPHLDTHYATFGKLVRGWDTLKVLEATPRENSTTKPAKRIEILKAEILEGLKNPDTVKMRIPKAVKAVSPTPK